LYYHDQGWNVKICSVLLEANNSPYTPYSPIPHTNALSISLDTSLSWIGRDADEGTQGPVNSISRQGDYGLIFS